MLGVGKSDFIKEKRKAELKKRKRGSDDADVDTELGLPPLQPDGAGYDSAGVGQPGSSLAPPPKPGRTRRTKAEMADENAQLFGGIVDLRAVGVHRRQRFDFAFTTDGVCARVQMRSKAVTAPSAPLSAMPKRGIWATNIGTNFTRLVADQPPIRSMTDEDLAFHRASLCLECD